MVSCFCSDEEAKQSPEVVEVPLPPPIGDPKQSRERGILQGSKHPCDLKGKSGFVTKSVKEMEIICCLFLISAFEEKWKTKKF